MLLYDSAERLSELRDHSGRTWTYTYDTSNNLTTVTYPDGTPEDIADNPKRIYHYEDTRFPNHLTGITDERGIRYATFEYDATGKAIASYRGTPSAVPTERAGGITIEYDPSGFPAGTRRVTNSRGQATVYSTTVQNGVSLPTATSGPGCSSCGTGGEVGYRYDPATNDLLEKTENGQTTEFGAYDDKGQYGYRIEAKGTAGERRTDYTYDPRFFGKIATQSEPSVSSSGRKVTTNTWDDWGNKTAETITGYRPDGTAVSRTTTWRYDGPLHQLSQIDGPRTDVLDITPYEYYADDAVEGFNRARLKRVTNALGQIERDAITYTATGQVASETRLNGRRLDYAYYPGNDRLQTVTETGVDGLVRTTRWTWLPTGELESVTVGDGTSAASTLGFGYDAARRLVKVTDGSGAYVEYTLDTEGNRTGENRHDREGVLVRSLTRTFDVYNRIDTETRATGTRDLDFDPDGTLAREKDTRNVVVDYGYDDLKRLVRVTADVGGTDPATANSGTETPRDAQGEVAGVTAPNGAATTYVTDDLGNRLSETSPDRGLTRYAHDAAGNVTQRTDARNQVYTYAWDALNRLTKIDGPGTGSDVTQTWDACANGIGKLCQRVRGIVVSDETWNGLGDRVLARQTVNGGTYEQAILPVTAGYDAAGRLNSLTYPGGFVLKTTYDGAGQVAALVAEQGGTVKSLYAARYADTVSKTWTRTYGNGLMEALADQEEGVWSVAGAAWTATLRYDGEGNVLSEAESGAVTDTRGYGYDALSRLRSATGGLGDLGYTYDANGNRLSATQGGLTTALGVQAASNRLTGAGPDGITHDANGNITAKGLWAYTWTEDDRLLNVKLAGVVQGRYTVDGRGLRARKGLPWLGTAAAANSAADRKTIFVHDDAGHLLVEAGPTGEVRREYVWGDGVLRAFRERTPNWGTSLKARADLDGDGVVSGSDYQAWKAIYYTPKLAAGDVTGDGKMDTADNTLVQACGKAPATCKAGSFATAWYYTHGDDLGRVRAVSNDRNVPGVVWRAGLDPFGASMPNEDPDGDGVKVVFNLRYPGQYADAESGLFYNHHRTYDPATGRYISSDPIGLAGGVNTYAYVFNNPLRYTDPSGLYECTCVAKGPTGTAPDTGRNYDSNGGKWCRYSCRREDTREYKDVNGPGYKQDCIGQSGGDEYDPGIQFDEFAQAVSRS